jgi:hypothetical protein
MFRSPSGLIWRFFLTGFASAGGADPDSPRNFAHLAFCAKAIRRLAPALIFLRLRGVASGVAAVPFELPVSIARSSAIWASMRSFWAVNPSTAAWMSSSFSFIGKSVFPPTLIFTHFVEFLDYLTLNLSNIAHRATRVRNALPRGHHRNKG